MNGKRHWKTKVNLGSNGTYLIRAKSIIADIFRGWIRSLVQSRKNNTTIHLPQTVHKLSEFRYQISHHATSEEESACIEWNFIDRTVLCKGSSSLLASKDPIFWCSSFFKYYMVPIVQRGLLTSEEVSIVFGDLEIILLLNQPFMEQLEEKCNQWPCTTVCL